MSHSLSRIAAWLMCTGLYLTANADQVESGASDRAIHQRENVHALGAASDISLQVKPVKPHFKVNESMAFRVQANRDFYLYVFTQDEATGYSVLLIPNPMTRSNYMSKDKVYTIPGTSDFYSDSVGYEKLVFIATNQPLAQHDLRSRPFGDWTKVPTKDLEGAFSTRGIHFRPRPGETGGQAEAGNVRLLSVQVVAN